MNIYLPKLLYRGAPNIMQNTSTLFFIKFVSQIVQFCEAIIRGY